MKSESLHQRGVTFVELAATVAIAAILGSIAVPGFVRLHRSNQRTVVINDFLHSVFFARSESLKRRSTVSICRSNDGSTCANNAPNWNGGWIVFENLDSDQPANSDPGEPVLLRRDAIVGGTLTSNRASFSFRPYGQGDVNGTLIYCPTTDAANNARAIIISHTGRPRTSNRDANGNALKC